MPAKRLAADRKVLVLAALNEGMPIRACCRMFKVGKNTVTRLIAETGEALEDYTRRTFRGLECERIEIDEQWQYVGIHGLRMVNEDPTKGDFWLWCALDPDSKLVISYRTSRRDAESAEIFIADLATRVDERVQLTTDASHNYRFPIARHFPKADYAMETKCFQEAFDPSKWPKKRMEGIERIGKALRKPVQGFPHIKLATTAHVERVFLTVRQEMARFTRCTLGYSKDLIQHKHATAIFLGAYNLCRPNYALNGLTPAQAAGLEEKRWTMEDVVALTENYWKQKSSAIISQ